MPTFRRSSIAALAVLACLRPIGAQAPTSAASIQVLILGTYHFANPGQDIVHTEVVDVRSAVKQAEISTVVEALARFRPTKIAVEHMTATGTRLDSLFAAYRADRHALSPNETQQLGFRLARRFGHSRVYPIDYRGEFPFQAVMEYAEAHDSAFVTSFREELARIGTEANRRQRENTIGEILRTINEPKNLAGDHASYIRFARVGAGDGHVGATLLAKWYERNIHIFANLRGVAKPGDRILVLVGSGHAPILRELVTADPEMVLMNVLEYLPTK